MTAFVKEVGSFTCNTVTGPQVISLSNFSGETIKAIIFFGQSQTAAGTDPHTGPCFGIATSATVNAVIASGSRDAVTTTVASTAIKKVTDNRCLYMFDNGNPNKTDGNFGEAHITALGDNQFTLNWDIAPAEAFKVNYIVLGGSDLKVDLRDITVPASDGNVAYTGTGFTPTGLIGLIGTQAATKQVHAIINLGFSDGTNDHNMEFAAAHQKTTSDTNRRQTAHLFDTFTFSGFARGTADVVSLDSDGYTLNWTNTTTNANFAFILALGGVNCEVGIDTQKTSAGTKATTTTFLPDALLLASFGNVADAGEVLHSIMGFGASDGTTNRGIASQDKNALGASDCNGSMSAFTASGSVLEVLDPDAVLVAAAIVDSFNATDFTLDWTVADATAREFFWMVLGTAGPPPPPPDPVVYKSEVGRVAAGSGTQVVSLSGFENQTIKAIIFFGATNLVDGVTNEAAQFLGYSTGPTKNAVLAWGAKHGVGTTDTSSQMEPSTNNRCIHFFDSATPGDAASTQGQAHVSAFGDNQFTLVWDVDPAAAHLITFLVIGGTGVQAGVIDFLSPVSDGNVALTGLSFKPTALLSLNHASAAGKLSSVGSAIGFSDGTNDQCLWVGADDNVGTSDTNRQQETEFIRVQSALLALRGIATVVSLDADGFTLAWTDTASGTRQCSVLALAGLRSEVGTELQKNDGTGTKQTPTNIPPDVMLFNSWGNIAAAGTQTHAVMNLGVASTAAEFAATSTSEDAQVTTVTKSAVDTAAIDMRTEDGTQFAVATLDSVGTASFTLDWTTADANAREFSWMAFAPLAPLELKFKGEVGSFVADTAGGAQLVELSGLDGQNIKAIVFFSSSRVAVGFGDHAELMCGFATPTADNSCVAGASQDGVPTMVTASVHTSVLGGSARAIYLYPRGAPSATFGAHPSAHVSAFGNNSFTVTWDVDPTEATLVNYAVISGSDVKAKILDAIVPTLDGDNVLTGAGFQPTVAFGLIRARIIDVATVECEVGMGFVSATEQAYIYGLSRNGVTTSDTKREFGLTHFLEMHRASTAAIELLGDLKSFDPDGMTVSWTNASSAEALGYEVLVLGGVRADIGSGVKPVTVEERAYPADFQAKLLFTMSTRTGNFAVQDDIWLNILGASDGVNNRCAGVIELDAVGTSDCHSWQSNSVLDMRDIAGNEDGTAVVESFNPQNFNLNWTAADVSGSRVFVWMILAGSGLPSGSPGDHIRHLSKFPVRWGNRRRFEGLR